MKNKKAHCQNCNKVYTRLHASRKYCSDKCKVYAWHKRNGYTNIGFVKNEILEVNQKDKIQLESQGQKSNQATTVLGTVALNEAVAAAKNYFTPEAKKSAKKDDIWRLEQRIEYLRYELMILKNLLLEMKKKQDENSFLP